MTVQNLNSTQARNERKKNKSLMKRASPYVNLAGLVLSMFICMLVDLWIHDKIKIFSGVNTSITKTALIPKNIKSSKNISFSEDAKNLCLILKPAVYDPKLF